MRMLRVVGLILLTAPAWAADLADRARVAERDRRGVMVASMAPLAHLPILPQFIQYTPPGGSASIGGTVGGGTATRVLFLGAGSVLADDTDFTYNSTTNALTIAGVISSDGLALGTSQSIQLLEGAGDNLVLGQTGLTPDSSGFYLGTTSNGWHVAERADAAFDFNNGPCGTAACTDPTLTIHSAVQNTTAYHAIAAWGTARKYHVTLTESVATKAMQIPVAAEIGTGGQIWYTIYATDGSTPQARFGRVIFALTADAAVETCTLGTPEEVVSSPVGTLTVTVACDVATPANAADITLSAVSSLTQTTLEAYVSVDLFGPGQPARP